MTDREAVTVPAVELRAGDYILHRGELCMISSKRRVEVGDGYVFTIGPRKGAAREYAVAPDLLVERIYIWPDGPPPPPRTPRGRR